MEREVLQAPRSPLSPIPWQFTRLRMIEVRRQGGRFGFRRKLYWRLSFMLTALCLTFCVGFTLILLKSLRELTDQTLELENWSLASELATDLAPYSEGTVDFAKFQEVLARFRRFSPAFNVLFLDRNGTRLAIDGVDQTRT